MSRDYAITLRAEVYARWKGVYHVLYWVIAH